MRKGYLLAVILSGFVAVANAHEKNSVLDQRSQLDKPLYQKRSVEEILNKSDDEELVKISGEIVKKIKGKIYLFRGETGEIKVVIEESAKPDHRVKLNSPVVIKGEVDNPPERAPRVEVDDIHYVF